MNTKLRTEAKNDFKKISLNCSCCENNGECKKAQRY